jgi:hypothetical protein
MAFSALTPYARVLLRGGDKDKSGKSESAAPWPQYAHGDENGRRGESARSGESAGLARGGQLKRKPRGARPAKPGASGPR